MMATKKKPSKNMAPMAKAAPVEVEQKEVRQIVLLDSGFHGEMGEEKPHYYIRRNGHIEGYRKVGSLPSGEPLGTVAGTGADLPSGDALLPSGDALGTVAGTGDGEALVVWLEAYGALACLPAGEDEDGTVWYEYCPACKYRGEQYWDMYTDKQLAALERLLSEKVKQYGIRFWLDPYVGGRYVSEGAIGGAQGVFLGGCFRPGMVGCHPQIELMKVLKRVAKLSVE